jgi:hypothetical protein
MVSWGCSFEPGLTADGPVESVGVMKIFYNWFAVIVDCLYKFTKHIFLKNMVGGMFQHLNNVTIYLIKKNTLW